MTDLFEEPVLVEVTDAEGAAVQIQSTHRGVKSVRRSDYENAKLALAEHLARISRNAGGTVGVVVFNAATDAMLPLSFLVATDVATRDATDEELPEARERHWDAEHKAWKREHRTPRRRVAPELVPAAVATDRASSEPVPPPEAFVPRVPDLRASSPERAETMIRAATPPAQPTRRQVRDMDSLMDRGKHVQHAQDGWRGALNALGANLAPGPDEQERRKHIATIQKPWKGTKHAGLLDEKGSTGKTPGTLMLAAAISRYHAGTVIVRDGNPSGNAFERAEFVEPMGRHADGTPFHEKDLALLYAAHGVPDQATIAQYLYAHTTDGYQLLTHHESVGDDDPMMTPDQVDDVYEALDPHAVCVVTDTGNSPWEARDRVMLDRLDQLVVPFLTYPDRENGARKTLERLEAMGGHCQELVSNAVMIVNVAEDTREHRRRAQQWAERWRGVVRHVHVVPYDGHLASHSLRFGDLALPTRTAFLRVAASVTEGFRGA